MIEMRLAVPVWKDRVSPVFDVASRVDIFTVENGAVTGRSEHRLGSRARPATLSILAVDVVLCSALSRTLETALRAVGIEVVREVCGPVDEVVQAYVNGTLAEERFLTPASTRRPRRQEAAAGEAGGDRGAHDKEPPEAGGHDEPGQPKTPIT